MRTYTILIQLMFSDLYTIPIWIDPDHYDSAINYIRMIPRKYQPSEACMPPVVIGLDTIALPERGMFLMHLRGLRSIEVESVK